MVLIKPTQKGKSNALKDWLELIGQDRNWLCDKLHITNGYVTQIMNGGNGDYQGVSSEIISVLLMLTNFKFEKLFIVVPDKDNPNHQKHNYGKFKEKL